MGAMVTIKYDGNAVTDDEAAVLVEAAHQIVLKAIDENTSKYGEGYTHAILVRGENQAAIDAYRNHPDHARVATIIESMEDKGIGVDFSTK